MIKNKLRVFLVNFALFGFFAFVCNYLVNFEITSYLQLIFFGVVIMIVSLAVFFSAILLVRYDVFVTLKELFPVILRLKSKKIAEE